MKNKRLFNCIYPLRHVIALFCMVLGFFLIYKTTVSLYAYNDQSDLIDVWSALWNSNEFVLRLILIFNFIIKPVFIYLAVIFLFWCIKTKN